MKKETKKLLDTISAQYFGYKKDKKKQPGFSILVEKNNEEVYKYSLGLANIEKNIEINSDTRFHVASIAKQFTAYVLNHVIASCELEIETPIESLSGFEAFKGSGITIQQLLEHKSGIKDQWEVAKLKGWNSKEAISTEDITSQVSGVFELNFIPGSNFMYSNTGYTLLANIIEVVTGNDFREYANSIINESGLSNTFFYKSLKEIENRTTAYKKAKDGFIGYVPNFDVLGSTSLVSTINDLSLWLKTGFDKLYDSNFKMDKYHNGLIHRKLNGYKIIYHSGWDFGYSSIVLKEIQSGISTTILSNSNKSNLFNLSIQILDIISGTNSDQKANPYKSSLREGFYKCDELNLIYKVSKDNERLLVNDDELVNIGSRIISKNKGIEFISVGTDYFSVCDFYKERRFYHFSHNFDNEYTIEDGIYFSEEIGSHLMIKKNDNKILLSLLEGDAIELTRVSKKFFYSSLYTLEFLEEDRDRFSLSNHRITNVIYKEIK